MRRANYIINTSEDDWLKLSASVLVDPETWEICQQRLRENRSTLGGNPERRFMLSGLLRCPVCGGSMSGENSKGYRYYNCTTTRTLRAFSGPKCLKGMLRADVVETLMLRDIKFLASKLASKPERFVSALHTYARKREEANAAPDQTEQLRQELNSLTTQEAATAKAQVDALIKGRNADVYDRLLTEIDGKRKALQVQLAKMEQRALVPCYDARTEGQKIAEVLRRVDAVLSAEELSAAEKHLILSKIIKVIRPEEDGYSVELLPSGRAGVGGLGTVEVISIR